MAKFLVLATARGYFGRMIRNPGDRFEVSAEEFSDVWMEPVGGVAPVAAPASDAMPLPPPNFEPVPIPADWKTVHYSKRIALAKLISGMDATAEQATAIIQAETVARDALARGLATAPVAPTVSPEAAAAAELAALEAVAAADEAAERAAAEAAGDL